jgi:RHS repeat-associated protein
MYKYDLAPVVDIETTVHLFPGNFNTGYEIYFLHDHADRVLRAVEAVDFDNDIIEDNTVAYRYNELGDLQSKWLHSKDAVNYLRRTDYTHNIRGWLTDGKTMYKKAVGDPPVHFFGFGLNYVSGANYTNGNISQMQWQNKDEAAFTKGLNFSYDGANRLLGSSGMNGYAETENGLTYDKNGNIKTLVRAGAVLDNLTYTYLGNRLLAVNDASGSNLGIKSGASSYGYDGNGNMTSDGNRGATLAYNYSNLPKTVTIAGKTLTYDYDAAGSKHKYVTDTMTVKYAGGFEYRQVGAANQLYRISLREGQAVLRGNKVSFEYFLKDHLGNVRVVFNEKGETLQRTDYYPFGLSINRDGALPKVQNWVNRYLYNGKELQVGTEYLDFGARLYMPEAGRWGVVDPMAEKNHDVSGYSYVLNNPILYMDPFGLDTSSANANKPVNQGDVIVFDNGSSATQSANEATVKGQGNSSSQSAGVTMILPGSFSPTFRPGPTTIPRAAPLLIPVAYAGLDAYLKGSTAIEDIAQILERIGVPSEVLRGPRQLNAKPTPTKDGDEFIKLRGNQGWVHKKTGEIYKESHTSHGNPGNVGQQWKVWPKGTTDFGSNSKRSGQRTTLDGDGNIIGN